MNWLNPAAKMWMPPLPDGVLESPAEPGLRITYADDGFLFATKLIAQWAKDADDLVALAGRLSILAATPDDLEAGGIYSDEVPASIDPVPCSGLGATLRSCLSRSPRMWMPSSRGTTSPRQS